MINTLKDAIELVESRKDEGCSCPCCGQFVKRYRRKITSAMAYGLILLHQESKGEWIHMLSFFTERKMSSTNEMAKLRHWGLIEKKDGEKEDGNPNNGYYRITRRGILFAEKMISVPRYCFIYNDTVSEFSSEQTNITQALGDKFNYSELMPQAFEWSHQQGELL